MPLEYQRGSVYLRGKRKKAWYGKYRVWLRNNETKEWVTAQRNRLIGLKSEMTRFEAEQKLHDMIAVETGNRTESSNADRRSQTLEWFFEHRYIPMMTCRETTKKKTIWEIHRYILKQFGKQLLSAIGLFELQGHLNDLARTFSDSVVRHTYTNLRSLFNAAVELAVRG